MTRCPQHLQLTVCRVPIHEVKLNASRQSRRQPETELVRSERSQSGDLRRSALVIGRTCPPPSQPLPPIFFQRVHLCLMPTLPVIAIEKQNACPGSRPIAPGRAVHRATVGDQAAGPTEYAGFTFCRSGCRPKNGDIRKIRRDRKIGCRPCVTRGARGKNDRRHR